MLASNNVAAFPRTAWEELCVKVIAITQVVSISSNDSSPFTSRSPPFVIVVLHGTELRLLMIDKMLSSHHTSPRALAIPSSLSCHVDNDCWLVIFLD